MLSVHSRSVRGHPWISVLPLLHACRERGRWGTEGQSVLHLSYTHLTSSSTVFLSGGMGNKKKQWHVGKFTQRSRHFSSEGNNDTEGKADYGSIKTPRPDCRLWLNFICFCPPFSGRLGKHLWKQTDFKSTSAERKLSLVPLCKWNVWAAANKKESKVGQSDSLLLRRFSRGMSWISFSCVDWTHTPCSKITGGCQTSACTVPSHCSSISRCP